MAKRPSLSRRQETATTGDENRDGRIDQGDTGQGLATERIVSRTDGDTGARPAATGSRARTGLLDRKGTTTAEERTVDTRTGTATDRTAGAGRTEPPAATPDVESKPDVVVDHGPRPRASMLATLSLILGVAGVLFVLTGTLAGYGIGIGAVGALLAVGGLGATRRRHVAGKSDSLFGLVLGLGAVVLGVLAMSGQFDWPNTHADTVQRFREWLDTQFVNRF